jgi:sugar phosphate isomerase/epimerase
MNLKLIKATWGMTGSLEEQFARIAEAGYQGVEAPVFNMEKPKLFKALLKQYNLDFIAQVVTFGGKRDVAEHVNSFRHQIELAASFEPLLIVSHSAKDSMEVDDQYDFFKQALRIENEFGIPVGHETHRGRAMFTPWTTSRLLHAFPALKITADISHWFCVCESDLRDQIEHMEIAAERTIHIHGRVGYAEGPQVTHPGAPEFKNELENHEAFWELVLTKRKGQGILYQTITPEFGPAGYMHTLPFTNQPVSDLWEVCSWMKDRLTDRFA